MINRTVEEDFVDSFEFLSEEFERNALHKGFWEGDPTPAEKIALMHQELSELLDAYRVENKHSQKIPAFLEAEEELADLLIRAMDFAYHNKLRLAEAILAKHKYNTTRPYKHGKKF